MKLLYVIGSMEIGGAEQHLLKVATALRSQGFRPEVFSIETGGPLTKAFVDGGIPVHGVKLPKWLTSLLCHKRAIAWVGLFYSAAALWLLYWRYRPQVIHFFLPAAYIIGGTTSFFGPRAYRIMSRRSLNFYQAKHRLFCRLEHLLHPKMDRVCGNSKAVIKDLLMEGVRSDQLHLIYNGISLDSFRQLRNRAAVRSELSISNDALVFIIVANLIPYKGHTDLIEAFGQIKDRLSMPWTCLCIGRDDGIKSALCEQAASLEISDKIRFLGSRQDVPDLLNAADIGILCSHEEGFSNAVLEYMATSLPIIATDVGGNAEAIVHGTSGLVVSAHAPEQLAEAILSMVLNPERTQVGKAGRHRLETLFSMKSCVHAYIDLYRDLCTGTRNTISK